MTLSVIPETPISTGGSIILIFPQQITTQPSTTCAMSMPTQAAITIGVTCSYKILTGSNLIQLTININSISAGTINNYFQITIQSFQNPSSTTSTDSFDYAAYSGVGGAGTKLDYQNTDMILKATADTLKSITLSPSSTVVGDLKSVLAVTMTIKNTVPVNGKIYVTFPYWNIDSSDPTQQSSSILSMVNSGPKCTGTQNINASATCTFDSSTQILTLSYAFTLAYLPNTVISFNINSIKNPISTQMMKGFTVSTGDINKGLIDTIQATLQVTTEAKISSATVSLSSYVVQKYAVYTLEFAVPVPLKTGCLIYLGFPYTITLDSQLTSITGMNFFGVQRSLLGSLNTDSNTYQITTGCPSYMSNTQPASITLSMIANPFYVMTTTGIDIIIYDAESTTICSTQSQGPTVKSTADVNTIGQITADDSIVDTLTNLIFRITPVSKAFANSQLVITIPTEFTLNDPCSVLPIIYVSSLISCSRSGQIVTFDNLLDSDYTYSSTQQLQFKLLNVRMPPSTMVTSVFEFAFNTFSTDNNQYNLVDYSKGTNLLQSTVGYLTTVTITPTSYVVNAITSYTIKLKINHRLTQNSLIKIVFPSELSLEQATASPLCQDFSPLLSGTATCISNGLKEVNLQGWFTSANGYTDTAQELSFTINRIQNPRSVSTTASFTVSTSDSQGYLIDKKADNLAVTMSKTSPIYSASVTPSSLTVGSITSYVFKVASPFMLINGDIVLIQFSSDIGNSLSQTYTGCAGVTYLATALTCKLQGPYGILVTIKLSGSGTSSIPAKASFSFRIEGIQNPGSTKPTSLFSASIYDSKNAMINSMNDALTAFNVEMGTPSPFKSISVSHLSKVSLESTSYVFTWTIQQTIPADAQMIITYPSQITLDYAIFACAVDFQSASPRCSYSNVRGNQNITIENVNNVDIQAGTTIKVTVDGLINSQYASATNSFKVFLYTSEGYAIAQSLTGLTVTNDCDYPCYTCMTGQPSKCLSCKATSPFSIYHNNQCISACPYGMFSANYKCFACDSSCVSCTGSSTNCATCQGGFYFLNNQCLTECPKEGYYQNEQLGRCQLCDSPCFTCGQSTSQCTSCLQNITQNLFFKGVCYSQCPDKISVNENGVCVSCSDNCATCTNSRSVCTSCYTSSPQRKLDLISNTCMQSCPVGVTVDEGDRCVTCDQGCKTCSSTKKEYCLSCLQGLFRNVVTNQCLTDCPKGTAAMKIPLTINTTEDQCQKCDTGCLECQNATSYCTKCDDAAKFLFFNYTCVQDKCPHGFTRLSKTRNVCVRDGLVCDFGYEFNDFGECILGVAQCEKGYILNRTKDKCIPKPIFYIPFLFTALALAWSIYIIVTTKKPPRPEKHSFYSQLLLGYTIIQTVSYVLMFFLSIYLNYPFIIAVHLVGIVAMYLCNAAGAFYFKFKTKKEDQAFKHWLTDRKKLGKICNTHIYIQVIDAIVAGAGNFKLLRGLYSKAFHGKEWFSAVFNEEYESIVKPLFILTVVNTVIQAFVIFALEILEFRIHKQMYLEQGGRSEANQYLVNYKSVKGEHEQSKVMGAMADDESHDVIKILRDQTMDYINPSECRLYETKPADKYKMNENRNKIVNSEAKLLENLIRKIGEERKFNEINEIEDDLTPGENKQEKVQIEEELSLKTSNKQNLQPLSDQGKKYAVEQLRDRIENKLLGRVQQMPQGVPETLEEQMNRLNIGLDLQMVPEQQIQNKKVKFIEDNDDSNMESARTEKYKYQLYPLSEEEIQKRDAIKQHDLKRDADEYNHFFDEIQDKLDRNFESNTIRIRDWHSFDEDLLRDQYAELEVESDFGEVKSNYSFPMASNVKEMKDPQYLARLELFREKMKSQYQYNNMYAERINPFKNQLEMTYNTRRTQTYEKEVKNETDLFDQFDQYGAKYEEDQMMELDPTITRQLLAFVIDNISSGDLQSHESADSQNSDAFGDDDSVNQGGRSSRKGNKKKRKRDIQFELDDIVGAFDIDDFGNIILNKETMRDNFNRKVNKHGYLIDNLRNIINQDGDIIFEVEELDSDEEIPMPYKFEQRKKQLLQSQEKFTVDPKEQMLHLEDGTLLDLEDEKVLDELNKLKSMSRPSSVDSQIGDSPSKFDIDDENGDANGAFGRRSKNGKKFSRKEMQLARAYGGSPQATKPPKKKKTKKKKRIGGESGGSDNKNLERQATDRLFPSLIQEEERVRKLQQLAHNISKDKSPHRVESLIIQPQPELDLGLDLEEYFKGQMSEMNAFRDKDREELKKQIENEGLVGEQSRRNGGVGNGGQMLTHQDSATTTRSISRTMLGSQIFGSQLDQVLDPLQQLAQMDNQSLQHYMPIHKYQNMSLMKNAAIVSSNAVPGSQWQKDKGVGLVQGQVKMKPQYKQSTQQTQPTQNNHTLNASGATQEDMSPISNFRQEGGAQSTGLYPGRREEHKNFEFYLVNQQKPQLKSQYRKKNVDMNRKDSQLSNAGQFTIQGDSKLKEMEGIYLKKYGGGSRAGNGDAGSKGGASTIATGYSGGPRAVSSMRNNSEIRTNQQLGARFRPLQHSFVDDVGQINVINHQDFQSLGHQHEVDDFETVFGGMQKAMHKIEEIRQQERQKQKSAAGRMQRTLNASSSAMDRNRLNLQNNNWV